MHPDQSTGCNFCVMRLIEKRRGLGIASTHFCGDLCGRIPRESWPMCGLYANEAAFSEFAKKCEF
jgi:hypothetical protein